MKNKLTDLNNYLFEQIEKLNDEDLTEEQFTQQIAKAEAISKIAKTITETAALQLDAIKIAAENGIVQSKAFLPLLGAENGK